ncbi:MAG: hypothetical protein ACQCXQ_03560, partial [Verrucomicrobiales bacterium]
MIFAGKLQVVGLFGLMLGWEGLSARTWTNTDGKEIEADLVSAGGDSVLLRKDRKEFNYPLAKLSEADRVFVADWQKENEAAGAAGTGAGEPAGKNRTEPFDKPVPRTTGPAPDFDVVVVKEDKENNQYIYQSAHFRFESDRRLTSRVVSGFATIYEATLDAISNLPWGMPLGSRDGMELFDVKLFADEGSYHEAGGIPGSAGTARGPNSLALISSLGVKDTGKRLILEDISDNATLVHELTHAMRDYGDRGLPIWAIEGFAEYVASAPYKRGGRFDFSDRLEDVVNYVQGRKGVGGSFVFPVTLEGLLDASREKFYQSGSGGGLGDGALRYYASGAMTMVYFWHADQPEGDAEPGRCVRAWLKAVRDGMPEKKARKLLLDG